MTKLSVARCDAWSNRTGVAVSGLITFAALRQFFKTTGCLIQTGTSKKEKFPPHCSWTWGAWLETESKFVDRPTDDIQTQYHRPAVKGTFVDDTRLDRHSEG